MKSCVNVIVNSDEILMRQIHPTFIQDGRITSSVFEPMKKDKGHLSCTAKSKITEEEAYRVYEVSHDLFLMRFALADQKLTYKKLLINVNCFIFSHH